MNRRLLIFHPFLFGVVPLLALVAGNLDQMRPTAALRSGLAAAALCAVVCGALWLALRSWGRAAPLASLWLVLFYTYGHLYEQVEGLALAGAVVGKHRYLFPLWLAAGLLLSLLLWRAGRPARSKNRAGAAPLSALNQILNAAALGLVIFPLLQMGQFAWRLASTPSGGAAQAARPAAVEGASPNIYYIVLDGYSRADVMREVYGLDIGPFMEELRGMGFITPNCAQSNYGITPFSMFAALNMNYLDAPGYHFPLGSHANEVDTLPLDQYLSDNEARRFLAARGYRMVASETGYWWLDMEDADDYVISMDNPLEKFSDTYEVANFEGMFLRTTALRLASETALSLGFGRGPVVSDSQLRHYQRVTFALNQLEQSPQIPGKKFVYFHLIAPHAPFVFAQDGSFIDYERSMGEMPAYPNEVVYLNRRMLEIIRAILAAEETPPIIILQSDHSWDPRPEYRMRILNALYLPGMDPAAIPPDHTPVNTFRRIFNHYFGAGYPILEDRSHYSLDGDAPKYGIRGFPYRFTPIPAACMTR